MKDLTVGKESSLILQFAWPMLLGNAFQQLYNIVGSVIVGNYLGKEALAAVGASTPIIFTLISLIIGFSMGFTVIISQYFGAKNTNMVRRAIDTMNIFLFFSSILITIIGIYFTETILKFINIPADILPQAATYLKIYIGGLIFIFGYNGVAATLRGMGDSKTPLYFLILSTVLNIILVLLFVIVFKWGIAGAAIATVIAQGSAFITSVFYLNKTHKLIRFSFQNLNFDKFIFKKSFLIGFPSGLQMTFVSLGMIALLSIVNTFGTDVIAAYSVAIRIDSFASLPAMNLAMALSSFVGQNMGAGKTDRVKNGYVATLKMNLIITLILSSIILIFPGWIMKAFSPDINIINIGKEYLYVVAAFYLVFTTMFINMGVMRGAGDTIIPMFITLFSLWLIRIPLAWLLSKYFGYQGIWWSIPLAWISGMTLTYIYYKSGKWKNKAIVKTKLIEFIES
ncbi:MAG: MATE family efflux transporter [Bacteroidetes bacterium CG02_land_8_20_14_3_00_31_25]|nr:MAG: MATE family efflux transporter [Bacteroidetes bacterium CG02_land_8_20_14_3_00_31_25]PIY07478.1 MAG: MATE family efflux transporter [Bacteroidetes bacterium CG_4_10_14_3_um_filter_31_20]